MQYSFCFFVVVAFPPAILSTGIEVPDKFRYSRELGEEIQTAKSEAESVSNLFIDKSKDVRVITKLLFFLIDLKSGSKLCLVPTFDNLKSIIPCLALEMISDR